MRLPDNRCIKLISGCFLAAAFCLFVSVLPAIAQPATQQVETDRLIEFVMALDSRDVRLIQSRLRDLGYYGGQPHGAVDEATFKAIHAYYSANPGPVDKLQENIRKAVSKHDNEVVEGDGRLHLRREGDVPQQPLCLDLPGRSDCREGGG